MSNTSQNNVARNFQRFSVEGETSVTLNILRGIDASAFHRFSLFERHFRSRRPRVNQRRHFNHRRRCIRTVFKLDLACNFRAFLSGGRTSVWNASRRAPGISASGSSGECERVPVERVTSTGDNEGPATIERRRKGRQDGHRESGGREGRESSSSLARRSERKDVVGARNGTNDEFRASGGARGWDTTI